MSSSLPITGWAIPIESPLDRGVFSATADEFDQQLAFLKRESDIVRPGDIPDLIKKPGRYVMISFDDGYRDNYDLAFPILKSHGVPATFFLCTGFLDDKMVSWWDEIAWLMRSSQRPELDLSPWLGTPLRLGPLDTESSIRRVLARYKSLPTSRQRKCCPHCVTGRTGPSSMQLRHVTYG